MKNWITPDLVEMPVSQTANGDHSNKVEGIDGVDAHGSGNGFINKHGIQKSS